MNSEEIAVLRVLYKHKRPLELSALIRGFPDASHSSLLEAVSVLQSLSIISLTDCSSTLYVSVNREMRSRVLELLDNDAEKYNAIKTLERETHLKTMRGQCDTYKSHFGPEAKGEDRDKDRAKDLIILPKRALKKSAVVVLISFFFLGTVAALNSQTIDSNMDASNNIPVIFTSNPSSLAPLYHQSLETSDRDAVLYVLEPANSTDSALAVLAFNGDGGREISKT